MSTTPFPGADILEQVEMLKKAGFSEEQAGPQIKAMQGVVSAYDAATRKELATKGDVIGIRSEIQDVRLEIEPTRNSILTWLITLVVGLAGVILAALAYFK